MQAGHRSHNAATQKYLLSNTLSERERAHFARHLYCPLQARCGVRH